VKYIKEKGNNKGEKSVSWREEAMRGREKGV
jgi:hypothetical protein